jgi:para-nitrobenzyl esterase
MGGAWVTFARTGNPNHSGLPHWPQYDAESRSTMIFDSPCRIEGDPEGEGLRLIAASNRAAKSS